MDQSGTKKLFLFLLVLIPLYLTWTFDHSLWNPDETRDAGIASEMFRSGDFIVPKLNGEAFLEKPPLYYWTASLIYKLTGRVTAGTTRLPSVLYGILGVLFTYLIGKRLFNERTGFFAAAIMATSVQYFRMSHFALMDVSLAALVTGALYFYIRNSTAGYLFFSILAFYAKGFLGIILTGLVVALDLSIKQKPRELIKIIGIGIFLFSAFVSPWFWGVWKEGGKRFLEIFLIDNQWSRFFSKSVDHTEHLWFYYFLSFPADFLPWTLLFIGFLHHLIKEPDEYLKPGPRRFLVLWFFGLLIFFTLSSSKRNIYLLPLFPAASLLCAAWLDNVDIRNLCSWPERIIVYGTMGICSILTLAVLVGSVYMARSVFILTINLVPAAILIFFSARKMKEAEMSNAFYFMVGLLGFSLGVSSFSLAGPLDQNKSFAPFCKVVKANLGEGKLIGYDMSEMEKGVFGFYLNGPIKNLTNTEQLLQVMEKLEAENIILIANRNKIREIDSIVSGKLNLIYQYRPHKKTRSYLLYTNR